MAFLTVGWVLWLNKIICLGLQAMFTSEIMRIWTWHSNLETLIDNITFEMVKRCTWGTCKSDTRYPDRLKKADGTVVSFYSFPNAKKAFERREIWIRACCRGEKFVCTKDSYKISFRRLFCLSLLVALCRRKDTCPYPSSSLLLSFGYTVNKVVENI